MTEFNISPVNVSEFPVQRSVHVLHSRAAEYSASAARPTAEMKVELLTAFAILV